LNTFQDGLLEVQINCLALKPTIALVDNDEENLLDATALPVHCCLEITKKHTTSLMITLEQKEELTAFKL
jgi:hypothetical protein